MDTVLVLIGLGVAGYFVFKAVQAENEKANKGADKIVCPHCQARGSVTVKMVVRGKGISGGKATGALMTGGLSMFATGLSRNQNMKNLTRSNCGMSWDVA